MIPVIADRPPTLRWSASSEVLTVDGQDKIVGEGDFERDGFHVLASVVVDGERIETVSFFTAVDHAPIETPETERIVTLASGRTVSEALALIEQEKAPRKGDHADEVFIYLEAFFRALEDGLDLT